MGSLKQKRRKKLARAWADFQSQSELSDDVLKLARSMGHTLERLQSQLSAGVFAPGLTEADRIREIHRRWNAQKVERKTAIDAGLLDPPKKKKKKPAQSHDPQWVKAKAVCRLNIDDIRKAKELGLSPRTLMKNVPSPTQLWKLSVKAWIQEQYERRKLERTNSDKTAAETTSNIKDQDSLVTENEDMDD